MNRPAPHQPAALRRAATALLAVLFLLATGCNTVGVRSVRDARVDYNRAMNAADDEQVLLNLVRLRYRDSPFVLEATSLITAHVLGAEAAAGATLGAGSPDVDFGVGYSYEENPTVLYAPLSGEDFLERLLTPVQVETLYLLMRSGWSIERVLRCCVRQVGTVLNAPSADGPTPAYAPEYREFQELARELRRLQKARLLLLDSHKDGAGDAAAKKVGDGEGGGGESGGGGDDGGGGENGDAELSFYLVLTPDGVEALRRLDAVERRAVLSEIADADGDDPTATGVELVQGDPDTRIRLVSEEGRRAGQGGLGLYTRSLMGVLYFLSQAVEVPQDHVDAGWVTATAADGSEAATLATPDPDALNPPQGECAEDRRWACPAGSECLDWTETVLDDLFRVRVAESRPDEAYIAVQHRGHWFYIPDCDLQSKSTYLLLKQLFRLQAGSPKDRSSALAYSLGG